MSYDKEIRNLVIDFVARGGNQIEDSRLYKVTTRIIYNWLKQGSDHVCSRPGSRDCWKLDRSKLVDLVDSNPDMMLKELAEELGVSIHSVWHSLKVLGYSRKKMARYKEKKNYVNWTKSYLQKL